MNQQNAKVVVTQMQSRAARPWTPIVKQNTFRKKRLRSTMTVFAAVSLCLGVGAFFTANRPDAVQSVMQHVTADFDYGDSLGRLQFVSNVLPESAMVFLSTQHAPQSLTQPTSAQASHAWTQHEPWLEYPCVGDVYACQAGEIMTIVKNRQDEYTVRVLHENGYESIYSGLSAVHLKEADTVSAGEQLGTAAGFTAFELRKDGLSIQPVFAEI